MNKIRLVTSRAIDQIIQEMERASTIYILTSFAMKSGIELLAPYLRQAKERGAEIKLLTGDYLFITQPEALKMISEMEDVLEARLWRSGGVSFHPKAYLFERSGSGGAMMVGSSNLSRSALTYGVEWSLLVDSPSALPVYEEASEAYMALFYHENTVPINQETAAEYERSYKEYHWKHPNLVDTWTQKEELDLMFAPKNHGEAEQVGEPGASYETGKVLQPREVQVRALEEQQNTREEEYSKAMVVMATGLGKTYLAGFFARGFKRALFIAHREEILNQAMRSWQRVMPEKTHGIYNSKSKEGEADCVFASIYTLARQRHLTQFAPGDFDLIVVDEFHHAAADLSGGTFVQWWRRDCLSTGVWLLPWISLPGE
jgi:HKD family nuclease